MLGISAISVDHEIQNQGLSIGTRINYVIGEFLPLAALNTVLEYGEGRFRLWFWDWFGEDGFWS